MNADDIKTISYTDFVGFINQWNVPPGAYTTLNKWIASGQIDSQSRVLEVACTTGFSICNVAKLTGCSGLGIDISKKSIERAKDNKALLCPDAELLFEEKSGYDFKPTGERYTHIIVGAALRFFPEPEKLVKHLVEHCLVDGGKILSCEFYAIAPVPKAAVQIAQKTFDITPTTASFKDVMKPYRGLELYFQDNLSMFLETDEEISHYVKSTIDRVVAEGLIQSDDKDTYNAAFDRLVSIKNASNELRKYQNYATLVHNYESGVYPNRYTEVF
jgi:SAM-dependent methyltransferase